MVPSVLMLIFRVHFYLSSNYFYLFHSYLFYLQRYIVGLYPKLVKYQKMTIPFFFLTDLVLSGPKTQFEREKG